MAKENIKANTVTAPTLFIGVGGTGCRIIKGVAELCRKEELENISFVCLDTNVNDLSDMKGSGAHIFTIQTSNTQTVGSYLDYDEDALKNWFPKNAVLYDKTVSEGAGQVRAISRLALNATIKTGRIQPLYDAVDDLFRKNGKEMKQALRVAFASTASGGTGSGIILPLAMFLRDYVKSKYPNTSLLVRSLILLPETLDSVIHSNAEKESQRRNAYATIKEINAFMMKGSGFFDINEDLQRYSDLHVDFTSPGSDELRSLSLLPFDFCFLMDGQNAEDSTLINTKQYEKQASLALYEQNIGPMQKPAFSMEDNIIKEMSSPGNFGRNRFGGIGAGAVRYPYEDVADYVAYSWANDAIGGQGEAAKWRKYDNAFNAYRENCIKKGLASSEIDKIGKYFCDRMDSKEQDNFNKDLKNEFLTDANKRINSYFTALISHMHEAVAAQNEIKDARNAANMLEAEIDYKSNEEKRGHAMDNLDLLRSYEDAVLRNAQKAAEREAESVFESEAKTIAKSEAYLLTAPLKNAFGSVCHPNAIRYMLYRIEADMEKKFHAASTEVADCMADLEKYGPDAEDVDAFDVKSTRKKKEANLDDLCGAEKASGKDPSIFDKLGGYEKLYDMLNSNFTGYFASITKLSEAIAECEAFKYGKEYIRRLNRTLEKFYDSFNSKVKELTRKQEIIVESLRFLKGDSILNVCASKDMLEELVNATRGEAAKGAMLESELCGEIFDAVRQNAAFEREMETTEAVLEDRRVDIFDDIMLGYFKKKVRRDCTSIDMNIIQAIAMENRLTARLKKRNQAKVDGEKDDKALVDSVSHEDNVRYIQNVIAIGSRLSAPSIQRLNNVEPREINCIAYNKGLKDMREYRIEQLITDGQAVDTVSKYELHYFNALYNLTPDKLNKFASPRVTETRRRNAGWYHKAYRDYAKHIGPDSTKNMMTSTHIDKRWDSINVMPEIDFDFQKQCVMHIHQALIYGLIHGAIKHVGMSASVEGKKIYRYENSDKHDEELIVSNGTLCDEFYEILDALYINSAVVEDIEIIKEKKRARDETKNSNYACTTFAKELDQFCLDSVHEGPTSLFEIPVVYYNSLPNANRYDSEIRDLVDATILTFADELNRWEHPDDAKFILCDILKEQFILLINNYKAYDQLNMNIKIKDSKVVNMIFRKVKEIFSTTPEPDDFEAVIEELEGMLKK